jgi:hypothetical protein
MYCSAFPAPEDWSRLPIEPNAFAGPADPQAAFAALCKEFPEDELVLSGVAQRSSHGEIKLTPKLAAPGAPLVALRCAQTRATYDLLTESGLLASPWLPAVAMMADCATQEFAQEPNQVCIAFSLEDAIILRSLGLAAVTAHGLDQIDAAKFDELAGCFAIGAPQWKAKWDDDAAELAAKFHKNPDDPGETPPCEPRCDDCHAPRRGKRRPQPPRFDDPYYVVFAAWSLGSPVPPGAEAVMAHFKRVHELLEIDAPMIREWRPSSAEVQRFCTFHNQDATCQWLGRAVKDSLHNSLTQADAPTSSSVPARKAAEALKSHYELDGHDPAAPPPATEKKKAARDAELLVRQQFIDPLLREAEATENASEKQLKMNFVQTAHAANALGMSLLRQCSHKPGSFRPDSDWREDASLFLKFSSHMLAIYESLDARRTRRVPRAMASHVRSLPPSQPGAAGSPPSGS